MSQKNAAKQTLRSNSSENVNSNEVVKEIDSRSDSLIQITDEILSRILIDPESQKPPYDKRVNERVQGEVDIR